ncbi:MAG: hypothetical protein RI920_2116 [Pseudomonadota bacterium]
MQHEKLIALRQTVISVSLGAAALITATAAQADAPKAIAAKVEGAAAAASEVQVKPAKLPAGVKTTAGAAISKEGDNQYPGTSPVPQPKPRKDALEAGALKAKAKAAQ